MNKKMVKRCIRPQCMRVYSVEYINKYCDCGALLQVTGIEISNKQPFEQTKEPYRKEEKDYEKKPSDGDTIVSTPITPVISQPMGHLYLIPENEDEDEIEYKLGQKTLIGRSSDTMAVDVNLSQFGGLISRKHAVITYEQDGFYITNLSENHSVHVNNKVVAKGQKMKLSSEDGVILSKKVLLQFEEGE